MLKLHKFANLFPPKKKKKTKKKNKKKKLKNIKK
jgi:hypothetical protein